MGVRLMLRHVCFRLRLVPLLVLVGVVAVVGVAAAASVAVLVDDADTPSAEDSAFESALQQAGHETTRIEPQVMASNGLNATTYPLLAMDYQSTSIPGAYKTSEFARRLKEYMSAGGDVVLTGTAGEVLDVTGVTRDAFSPTGVGAGREIWFRVTDANHKLTSTYSYDQLIQTNTGSLTGAFYTNAPSFESYRVLGNTRWAWADWRGIFTSETGSALAVVHHANGTAVSLAGVAFGSNSPTAGLRTLLARAADAAVAPEHGGLRVTFDGGAPGFTGAATTVTARITATGGATVPGARAKVTVPAGVSITGGSIDGVTQSSGLQTYLLGDVTSGTTKTVVWTLSHSAQGVARYTVDATSTANRVTGVTAAGLKFLHTPGGKVARLAVLDSGDSTVAGTIADLRAMGWTVGSFVPQDVDENAIHAATHPMLVLPWYATSFPVALRQASFGAGLRAYMDDGGDLLLLGTAGEILDLAGITPNSVELRTTGVLTGYLRPTTTNHPVVAGLGAGTAYPIVSGGATGAMLDGFPADRGHTALARSDYDWSDWRGVFRSDSGNGLWVVPFGSGKAYGLATGWSGGSTHTDWWHTFLIRVVNAAEKDDRAHVKIAFDPQGPSKRLADTDVTATVTAYGGGSVPGVTTTLTYPAGATLVAVKVDGAAFPVLATVSLGDVADGVAKRVTWTLKLPTLGVNDFSVVAKSTESRVPQPSSAGQKFNHMAGTLGQSIAIVDMGDAIGDETKREIDRMGFSTSFVSTYDFDTRRMDPATYPVTVIYYYGASLPLALTQPSFGAGLKAYMDKGGDVVLLGTAAEALDAAGITDNAIGVRTTGTLTDYLRVFDGNHDATSEFTGTHAFNYGGQDGALLDVADSRRGFRVLGASEYDWADWRGTFRSGPGNGFYVIPYGHGKAYGLATGVFGANAPTDAFRTFVLRLLNAIELDALATVKISFDALAASDRGADTTVKAVVTAVGGGNVPTVTATLSLPAGATVVGGDVDGAAQSLALRTYALGAMPSGASKTVTWTVRLGELGSNSFTASAQSTATRVVGVSDVDRKFNHIAGGTGGRVAIVDMKDGLAGPLRSALETIGYQTELVAPYDVDNGRVLPSSTPRLIVAWYGGALPVDLAQPSFGTGLKEFLDSGGDVLLLGSAPEILDTAGITSNAVSIKTVGSLSAYLRVTDANADATQGLGGAVLQLNSGGESGATLDVVDAWRGVRVLGQSEHDWADWRGVFRSATGPGLFVVPHGHGKATALATGVFGTNSPTVNLENLVMRVLDGIELDDLAALKIEFSPLDPATQSAGSFVEAKVTALGGGSLPLASATITFPGDSSVVSGQVDGTTQARVLPRYELGDLVSGEIHRVRWAIESTGLGIHDFSARAESTSSRVPVVYMAGRKDVHMKDALQASIALVDLQDPEGAKIKQHLEWMGWTVRSFNPTDVKQGLVEVEDYPVMVAYSYAAALPQAFDAGFVQGFKNYANAGGNLVLLASAGKLLDSAAFTANQFTIREVGSGASYFETTDATHPITTDFGGTRNTNNGGQYGATIASLDPSLGVQVLARAKYYWYDWRGAQWADAGIGLAVVPAGGGRAVFASSLRFAANAPVDDTLNYLSRIVDYQVAYTKAPRTTVTLSGTEGVERWFRSAVEITLSAVPGVDGHAVESTYYRVNFEGPFLRYAGPITVTREAANTIEVYSVDVRGNTEYTRRVAVKIDYTEPSVAIALGQPQVDGNPRTVIGPGTKVTLRGTDNLAGVLVLHRQVDAGAELQYVAPFTIATYEEGPHEIAARATD